MVAAIIIGGAGGNAAMGIGNAERAMRDTVGEPFRTEVICAARWVGTGGGVGGGGE